MTELSPDDEADLLWICNEADGAVSGVRSNLGACQARLQGLSSGAADPWAAMEQQERLHEAVQRQRLLTARLRRLPVKHERALRLAYTASPAHEAAGGRFGRLAGLVPQTSAARAAYEALVAGWEASEGPGRDAAFDAWLTARREHEDASLAFDQADAEYRRERRRLRAEHQHATRACATAQRRWHAPLVVPVVPAPLVLPEPPAPVAAARKTAPHSPVRCPTVEEWLASVLHTKDREAVLLCAAMRDEAECDLANATAAYIAVVREERASRRAARERVRSLPGPAVSAVVQECVPGVCWFCGQDVPGQIVCAGCTAHVVHGRAAE